MPTHLWIVALMLSTLLAAGVTPRVAGQHAGAAPAVASLGSIEQQTCARVNAYRASKGLAGLKWNEAIAEQARLHSRDMASGAAGFGHDGFDARMRELSRSVKWSGVAENVFMLLNLADPAAVAVSGWIDSPGHRQNIEGDYDMTGVGIARADDGALYFTQIFVKSQAPHHAGR